MNRPASGTQQARILELLESAHGCGHALSCEWAACGRVALPKILALYISQYGARISELRHKWGYKIENGTGDQPEHTWFRLHGRVVLLESSLHHRGNVDKFVVNG
jgi:hypothetical protein